MFDLTLQAVFMRAGALVILATVQGMAVAAAAVALGDPGPRHDGRLSLAPARHLDALGAAGLILFGLGWSKPVDVDARRLRLGRAGTVLVVLAGAAALVAAAVALRMLVAPALTTLPVAQGLVAAAFLRIAAGLAIANAVFGMLPVPPLPGANLLALLGLRPRESWNAILGLALLAAVAAGLVAGIIDPWVARLSTWVQAWSPR